jgi:hypothetical protein
MVSMRKVETSHRKSSVDEFFELRDFPTSRAQSTDNLALASVGFRLGHDSLERNVGAAEFRAGSSDSGVGKHLDESRVKEGVREDES